MRLNLGSPDTELVGFDTGPDVDENFRGFLSHYHAKAGDIDCMVQQLQSSALWKSTEGGTKPNDASGRMVAVTSEELRTYAEACDADLSKLWRTGD
jgi:hypothetical protein